MDVGRITRQYPVETRVESYVQTDPEETDEEASTLHFIDSQWSDSYLDTGSLHYTYVLINKYLISTMYLNVCRRSVVLISARNVFQFTKNECV